jgi:lipopolysaccharide transport protein LptA
MVIRCGLAEIFPVGGEESQPRYVLKEQLALAQQTEDYELSAQAGEATYLPVADELILTSQVRFLHKQGGQAFDISAENLNVLLKDGQLDQLIATGEPATFSQRFENKQVVIQASRIDYIAETQTALMKDASLDDGVTTFSANEIEYNTTTGAISAKGQGDERPKYRFNKQGSDDKETTDDT